MGSPSNDCLAIARDFFCYSNFPKCKHNNLTEAGMCEHTCALWKQRCPNEETLICEKIDTDEDCTGAV